MTFTGPSYYNVKDEKWLDQIRSESLLARDLHSSSIDGPDLFVDGRLVGDLYAEFDSWASIAVLAPLIIPDLIDEIRRLRRVE